MAQNSAVFSSCSNKFRKTDNIITVGGDAISSERQGKRRGVKYSIVQYVLVGGRRGVKYSIVQYVLVGGRGQSF